MQNLRPPQSHVGTAMRLARESGQKGCRKRSAVTADALLRQRTPQTQIALVNTNRFPNGSVTVMSWLPHGMAWMSGRANL